MLDELPEATFDASLQLVSTRALLRVACIVLDDLSTIRHPVATAVG